MQPSTATRSRTTNLTIPVSVIALVISLTLVAAALITHNGDWDAFAMLGNRLSEGDPAVYDGYDGQFYYRIAQSGMAARTDLDAPSLRYMRIGYPFLVRILSLGQPQWVPVILVVINIIAITLGSGLLALLLRERGVSPYWALLYTAWPGVVEALRLDLAEPLCVALVLAAILAYEDDRSWLVALFLSLATLTKEIGLVIAGGLVLATLVQRQWQRSLIIGLVPLAVWAGWLLILSTWLGRLPMGYAPAHLEIPLAGWFKIVEFDHLVQTGIFLVLPTLVILGLALRQIWQQRTVDLDVALVLAATGFVLTMPDVSWRDVVAAYRVSILIVIAGLLFLSQYQRARYLIAALWIPATLLAPMIPGLFFLLPG